MFNMIYHTIKDECKNKLDKMHSKVNKYIETFNYSFKIN